MSNPKPDTIAEYFGIVVEHTERYGGAVVLLESRSDVDRIDAEQQAARIRRNTQAYAKVTVVKVQLTAMEET